MSKRVSREKTDFLGLAMLLGLIVLIAVVGLAFTVVTKDSTLIKNLLFCWLVTGLFLVLVAASLFRGELTIPRSKMMLPLGIWVLLSVVSMLFSRFRYASLQELTSMMCSMMLLFVTVTAVRNRRTFLLVAGTLAVVASLGCVYGISQHHGVDPFYGEAAFLTEQGRSFSTMGHPNFFGSFLVFGLPLLLSAFFCTENLLPRSLLMVLICAVALCLFYTQSRGAWLGLVAALPLWFFASAADRRWRLISIGPMIIAAGAAVALLLTEGAREYVILWAIPFWLGATVALQVLSGQPRVRFSKGPLWGVLLFVTIVVASNVFVDRDEVGGRMDGAFEADKGSVLARKIIWSGALNMWKAKPLSGWGVGTFSVYFPRFRDPSTAGKIMPNTLHAHSEYLEIGTEMGLLGLAVFLWMIGTFVWESVRGATATRDHFQRLTVAGLLAGCTAILLQSAVSVTTRWVVGRFFLWLGIGLTLAANTMDSAQEPAASEVPRGKGSHPKPRQRAYRLCFKPMRAPVPGVLVALAMVGLMVAAACWGRRVWLSAVLTRMGEGYEAAAASLEARGATAEEIAEAQNSTKTLRAKAIESLQRAVRLNPYNLSSYYKLAHCHNLQGHLEESLHTYFRMAKLAPDGSDIHFNLGTVYANMRRWEDSKREYQTALSMKVGPLTRLGLARAYENLKLLDKAREQYGETLKAFPNHRVQALNGLAGLHLRRGENAKALELYTRAVEIEPEDADARLGSGLIYQALGDGYRGRGEDSRATQCCERAAAELEIALRRKPANVPIRAALALVYADVGQFDEAQAQLRIASAIKPRDPLVLLNLGKVYRRMEQPAQAEKLFRQTMEVDPRGPWGAEATRELKMMGVQ